MIVFDLLKSEHCILDNHAFPLYVHPYPNILKSFLRLCQDVGVTVGL